MKSAAPVGPLRGSRGVAFAGAALGLGVGAHLAGGGSLPGLGALVLLAIPVAWISFLLTRAQRGWPVIILALVGVEVGLHEGLSLLTAPVDHFLPMAGHGPLTGAHAGMMTHTASGLPPAAGMSGMGLVPSLSMLAAHLVATVLTGAVLAYGEQLLWSLWSWWHHAVTVCADLVRLPVPRTSAPAWLLTVSPLPVPVNRHVWRRGPPRLGAGLPASV